MCLVITFAVTLDSLKTNSRSPLLSPALARNEAGSCPSAEMRKGVPLPFLNRETLLHLRSIPLHKSRRDPPGSFSLQRQQAHHKPGWGGERERAREREKQPLVEFSPRLLFASARMSPPHTSAPTNLSSGVREFNERKV